MARPVRPEIKPSGINAKRGPFDLPLDVELPHNVLGLFGIGAWRWRVDCALKLRNLAIRPKVCKSPGMVQQESGKCKQPEKEQEIESEIIVQFAVPDFEHVREVA